MKLADLPETGSLWVPGRTSLRRDPHGGLLLDTNAEGSVGHPYGDEGVRVERWYDGHWHADLSDCHLDLDSLPEAPADATGLVPFSPPAQHVSEA